MNMGERLTRGTVWLALSLYVAGQRAAARRVGENVRPAENCDSAVKILDESGASCYANPE
jgi:hypothetical protein